MKTQLPGDADDYFRLLRLSGLLTKEQLVRALEDFRKQTESEGNMRDLNALVKFLVGSNLVTPWQNQMLLEGRDKGWFFLGNYKVLARLGTGDGKSVFRVEHALSRRQFAILVLPFHEDAAYLKRFSEASQAAAALDHPNVVRVFDIENEGKIHFLVMEYIEGRDLASFVAAFGPLAVASAAHVVRQAADGLAYAHERKLIHREIMPANLLWDKSGVLKVLNIGLIGIKEPTVFGGETRQLLKILETCDYASPEQTLDSASIDLRTEIDLRTDIYSLGCTLYCLLTGHAPYPEGTVGQRLMQHHTSEPQPIVDVRPDVPQRLVEICRKMMAKKPDDRYQTCGEVRDALADWLQDHGRS